jgi:cyclohexyl-isocyanide hydratase
MLLFPNLTQLDLTGPYEVFHRLPNAKVHLLWKERGPVATEAGFAIVADTALNECPRLDILFVPGGFGVESISKDERVIAFLRTKAETARFVTSVCTGSLLLGAAGLLRGYLATTHWAFTDWLKNYDAIYSKGRVVRDRNRITAGGVTAGIDFGLVLAAELFGEAFAKALQLGLEYDPEPPFALGSPEQDPALAETLKAMLQERYRAP